MFDFGCLSQACNVLGLFLMFGFGFKVLRYGGCHCKGLVRLLRAFKGPSFDPRALNRCDPGADSLKFFEKPNLPPSESREIASLNSEDQKQFNREDDDEFEIQWLRRMLEMEKQRADAACLELEKERAAAASAAEEAMAMVFRLQSEKSAIDMEAHQFRRLAEQKQCYDRELIMLLRLRLAELECGSGSLAYPVGSCSEVLSQYEKSDECGVSEEIHPSWGHFDFSFDDGLEA